MPTRSRPRSGPGHTEAASLVKPVKPLSPAHPIKPVHPVHPVRPLMAAFAPSSELPDADAIFDLARQHIGENYILGARAPMANADWKGPWDCAEFVSWCVYQATGILFGVEPTYDPVRADAFTGYWADQAHAAGAIVPVEHAARIGGACVLRAPQSGRVGHIVLSDGKGGTVEAHSSARGVIAHTLEGRRWDCGILVPGVRYFSEEIPVTPAPPAPVLRYTEPMMRGKRIEAVQTCLNKLGYATGNADGVFGPQTESAVQAFQVDEGLVPDGEVGDATLAVLKTRKCKVK